ncbi:fimbria/pilus periplasmic chaperone [Bdellovibrio sp. 22V]|uniref:fimbrial biogenesis chaperone n=1 Tax=Bdellovibrio TaxID=958 RepID=UPI002542E286|nr:fimbria/pilus periplasmic chaperone [Bdellovibrio sp. 22V]WII70787.1 fimbria/pilus periplasmic chaperone [Bdellovibrio sp. 22V]
MLRKSVLTVLFFLFPSITLAFRLTPMVIYFSPEGKKTTQVLTLENPGNEKVPVQIEAFARRSNEKGEEVREKTGDFNIYPEQVVLLPNEKRNVRITWAGDLNDPTEKAYRIVASQLPVEFRDRNAKPKKAGVNLNFLLQYVASAYVTPEGAVAKVRLKDVRSSDGKNIQVSIANEGTAHKVLRLKKLTIYSGEKKAVEFTQIKELDSANLLPGESRTITLQTPQSIPLSGLRGEIELTESGD